MIKEVKTMDDVSVFTKEIIPEGIAINLDHDFTDMINVETDEPTYTTDEAELRNALMSQCFEVCDKNEISIYDFMQEIYLKETGLDKFIPLPSSLNNFTDKKGHY
jgi:hypothetical protein